MYFSPCQFRDSLVVGFRVERRWGAGAVANAWQRAHLWGLNGLRHCFAVLVAQHRVLVVEPTALDSRVHLSREGRMEEENND